MPYSTIEDVRSLMKDGLIDALLGHTYIDDPVEKETKVSPLIAAAISDADGEINGYLNSRYPTPLNPVPAMINKTSKDIAIFNLHSLIGIDEGERENIVITRYKNCIRYLENVAKGVISLGIQKPQETPHKATIQGNQKLFTRNSMRGY